MRWFALFLVVVALIGVVVTANAPTSQPTDSAAATALAAGKLPDGYRDWKLISVAREEGDLNDIRAVLGNDVAIKAYRDGTRPFPDGSIIVRLAWSLDPSEQNNKAFGKTQSFVAGPPKNGIQFIVKDANRFASTGGWSYSQFDDGKPLTNQATLEKCFTCHQAVEDQDYIFTHYAP